ncbi:ribosome-associated translation inhibitor RaiA [Bdellovibrio bacteriovorus]|uniref:ribosome hibernation-promoting factor, HPF/YfiA family n=1 Tax=Bdellovibrio bacteriovorus TaxID=959 RepID=UPI0021D2E45C|nr:ribosome-associated translation inhibitor RaiA [Bdellovibrio bacteriovorus]UXR64656.1 ribosome-associated translation inhibitor RaiA [Bdellovibrio bacteriovorus]
MKLNYTFKHLDHSDSLVNYTEEKMSEVGRFLLKEGYGSVYFSKQKNEFCVEISVNTREKYFKATAYGPDVYSVVDSVAEKLEKQFLKVNKQFKDHKKPESTKETRHETFARWKKAA